MTSPTIPPRHLSEAEAAAIVADGTEGLKKAQHPTNTALATHLQEVAESQIEEGYPLTAEVTSHAASRLEALTDALRRARVQLYLMQRGPELRALLHDIDALLGGSDA